MLVLFAIYVLSTGRLQITPHYGVEGQAARVGGYVCLATGLLLQALMLLTGLSFLDTALLSLPAIFVVMPLTLVLLVHHYGNDFALPGRRPRSSRSKRYFYPGLVLVVLYVAGIVITEIVALAMGEGLHSWVYAFSAALLGGLPGMIGLWLLVRASAAYDG